MFTPPVFYQIYAPVSRIRRFFTTELVIMTFDVTNEIENAKYSRKRFQSIN